MAKAAQRIASEELTDEDDVRPPLVPGAPKAVSPLVRRIVAPNPGPMTQFGTNTYLVGIDEVAVVDPGPMVDTHVDAIIGAAMRERIRWVLCTHTHPDHAAAAAALAQATGAELLAVAKKDPVVTPDRVLRAGDTIDGTEFRLEVVLTPGHAPNHVCFLLEEERLLLSGDTILEGTTSVISPKLGGDMVAYLDSLQRLRRERPRRIAPGHGYVIDDAVGTIDRYLAHRAERESEILAFLGDGPAKIGDVVAALYPDVHPELVDAAHEQVHAHLLKLRAEGLVEGRAVRSAWRAAA
ncbi:MAG: MBL fold metallo-hydrolase [Acidimicrobiia bacterium]